MKALTIYLVMGLLMIDSLIAEVHHHDVDCVYELYEWAEETVAPFNELMVTWNAQRPENGKLSVFVSVKQENWSPWMLYAEWGNGSQRSFEYEVAERGLKLFQDAVDVKGTASGFRVRVSGIPLNELESLHVCTSMIDKFPITLSGNFEHSFELTVPGISQMVLQHPRNLAFCSPTSTTAVVRYLTQGKQVDPVDFAAKVFDSGFNIYGNWVLNVAAAYAEIGKEWRCWVERLNGFEPIYQQLQKGNPVVVSVRSPLKGSASEYKEGHLIVVKGFDAITREVLCMDPAFAEDHKTSVRYSLEDFMQAWGRRKNIAYVFEKK